jgi:hypothetical protein
VKFPILLRGKVLTERPSKKKAALKEHIKSLTTANFDIYQSCSRYASGALLSH